MSMKDLFEAEKKKIQAARAAAEAAEAEKKRKAEETYAAAQEASRRRAAEWREKEVLKCYEMTVLFGTLAAEIVQELNGLDAVKAAGVQFSGQFVDTFTGRHETENNEDGLGYVDYFKLSFIARDAKGAATPILEYRIVNRAGPAAEEQCNLDKDYSAYGWNGRLMPQTRPADIERLKARVASNAAAYVMGPKA